jgi:hypothetical protein
MVGALWRPKMLRVATEADRQLHLPELLSSAAALPVAGARDDLDRVLRQMLAGRAAEACARTSPRRIRQRRFGANGWAAIALAAGVPVLLGTLVSPPAPARPGAGDSAQAMAAADGEDAPLVQLADSAAGPRQEMNPDEIRSAPPAADYGSASPPPSANPSDNTGGHITPSLPGDHSGNGNGAGAGDAHTNAQQPAISAPTDVTAVQASSPANSGVTAGGVGPAAIGPPGSGGNTAGGLGRTVDSDRPPPWRSPGWPAEAASARRQADAGEIPAAYIELVRDYFSRDEN